ncbi:MAG: hypothetical protein MR749_01965 [Succinatimonas hippei]|nr:hypothetical protein [Succinatimonas hippei]
MENQITIDKNTFCFTKIKNTFFFGKSNICNDDFEQDTNDALLQIEKKKYYEPFVRKVTINTIYCYGISFYNKQCYIAGKKIK